MSRPKKTPQNGSHIAEAEMERSWGFGLGNGRWEITRFTRPLRRKKVSALATADYLEERAKKGSRTKFRKVLSEVPNVEPDEIDAMPKRRPT